MAERLLVGIVTCAWALILGGAAIAGPDAEQELAAITALNEARAFPEAEARARALLATLDAEAGEPETVARTLAVLLRALRENRKIDWKESQALGQRLVDIETGLHGPDSPERASALLAFVRACENRRSTFETRRMAVDEAMRIRDARFGKDSAEMAEALYESAFQAPRTWDEAEDHFKGAIAIRERLFGGSDRLVSEWTGGLAYLYFNQGRYEDALASFRRAIEICETLVPVPEMDRSALFQGLGLTYQQMGMYAESKLWHERGLELRERLVGKESREYLDLIPWYSWLLNSMGLPEEARVRLEPVVAVLDREQERTIDATWAYEALGEAYFSLGESEKALAMHGKALEIREARTGRTSRSVAASLANIADVLLEEGRFSEAREKAERAIAIAEAMDGKEDIQVGWWLPIVGDALVGEGRYEEAAAVYARSIEIAKRFVAPEHPDLVGTTVGLATAQAALGKSGEALQAALGAEDLSRRHLQQVGAWLPERESLMYAAHRPQGLEVALSVLAGRGATSGRDVQAVWDAVLRSRGLVFEDSALRRRMAEEGGEETARLVSELGAATSRLAALAFQEAPDDSERGKERLQEARREKERVEEALAARSATFRATRSQKDVDVLAVRARLPAGAALVSFVRHRVPQKATSRFDFGAFVLAAGGGEPWFVPLGPAEPIESAVDAMLQSIRAFAEDPGHGAKRSEQSYRRAAETLRRAALDPLTARIGGARLVLVVPDGALNFVNLAALPGRQGRYLVEEGPVFHVVSLEREIVEPVPEHEGTGLLAVGNPSYDGVHRAGIRAPAAGRRSACGTFASLRFDPLPGSAVEVDGISRLWEAENSVVLKGDAATEGAIRRQAAGKSVVHFATHGFFLGGACDGKAALESPTLQTGLALAGANLRGAAGPDEEDGILTAEEVATLDLSGVHWAVLSACDTARGTLHRDEGTLGLRRAFRLAGARTVVMSLWEVDDASTARWMRALYEAHRREEPTASAVREASSSVLKERRKAGTGTHPFFWASFVAAGDWR